MDKPVPEATRHVMTDFENRLVQQREEAKGDVIAKANEIVEWFKKVAAKPLAQGKRVDIAYFMHDSTFELRRHNETFKMEGTIEFKIAVFDELYLAFEREFPAPGFTVRFWKTCCFGRVKMDAFWATVKWNEPREAEVV